MGTPNVVRMAELELFADCTKAELRRDWVTYHLPSRSKGSGPQNAKEAARREFIVIGAGTAEVSRETGDGIARVAQVGDR